MSLRSWWRDRKNRRRIEAASSEIVKTPPLREFVYLDEVSLHSLLVSQKSTIPENVSKAISRADEAEIAGVVGAKALGFKSELKSRYQTSNSDSTQSSRKAVVQTLFKEFRDLALDYKLVHHKDVEKPFADPTEILEETDSCLVAPARDLLRGDLIEVEVTLAVDPVFKLGAMMTEWNAMADDYPGMFGAPGLLGFLHDSEPLMKVLDRFLAELVPIKSKAIHYRVVKIEGHEYVVDKRAIRNLGIKSRPLYIVGVTEKLGYWKDLRRVLFSNAKFTVLCRVARSGIHNSWTPVKLADLFTDVAPGFVDQINAIEAPKVDSPTSHGNAYQDALRAALNSYRSELAAKLQIEANTDQERQLGEVVDQLVVGQVSPTGQRLAFDAVRKAVTALGDSEIVHPEEDLALRQNVRESAGLDLIPSLASLTPTTPTKLAAKRSARMLDVEVIGIYW